MMHTHSTINGFSMAFAYSDTAVCMPFHLTVYWSQAKITTYILCYIGESEAYYITKKEF